MRFRGGLSICVAAGLFALVLAPPLSAQDAECSKYVIFGLSPGMSHRDVWEVMDGKGERGSAIGLAGPVSTAVYHVDGGSVTVLYDRQISKKRDAKVEVLQGQVGLILEDLIKRLGVPTEGAEYLGQRQPEGAMVWTDAACGIEVTVYPESSGWWQPASATMNVEVRSLPGAGAASTSSSADTQTETNRKAPVAAPAAVVAAASNGHPGTPTPAVHEPTPANNRSPSSATFPPTTPAESLQDTQPAGPATNPYTAGVGGVSVPERIESSYVHAVYPTPAAKAQLTGRVILHAVVKRDGSVSDVVVLSCSQPDVGFEEAAIDAVRQWRYEPATLDGRPVDVYTTVTIQFR